MEYLEGGILSQEINQNGIDTDAAAGAAASAAASAVCISSCIYRGARSAPPVAT